MAAERVFAKCAWRLIPLITLLYFVSFLDRVNVGFAALTMNRDMNFTPEIYGFGAGVFFLGYVLFQVPANVILHTWGARRISVCGVEMSATFPIIAVSAGLISAFYCWDHVPVEWR